MKSLKGIYGITDDALLPESKLDFAVEEAIKSGCRVIQYRSKIKDWKARVRQAESLRLLCEQYQVPLIINDNVELCNEVDADGVHLGKQDSSFEQARIQLSADKIIGITCHDSVVAAVSAEEAGADYVAFGRFFPSETKPNASPAPIELLTEAKKKLSIPIVAIGGINAENGAALIAAGADMLAVINAMFADESVSQRTTELVALFN